MMMNPNYFRISAWSDETKALVVGGVPSSLIDWKTNATTIAPKFTGPLIFNISGEGTIWEDVLTTNCGVLLVAEDLAEALGSAGLKGVEFYDANILKIINNRSLESIRRRSYKWMRASGLIVYDDDLIRQGERAKILNVQGESTFDLFHGISNKPVVRYPCGYGCTLRVVEACRRFEIGNLHVCPFDYIDSWKGPIGPPFRLDLFDEEWPPIKWYPEWFSPDDSNAAQK